LLQQVKSGKINIDQAVEKLRHLPFEDLGFACIDHHRQIRRGFPEVIFCPGKTTEQIIKIFESLAEKGNNFTPVPTLVQLGFEPGDLDGTYFSGGESGTNDFSWVINSNNPINFLITATAPAGISSPSQITLNNAGIFTETQ